MANNYSVIKLNFVNESNDANNSSVVIFQKNVATNFDELAIAWKVIKNCGTGWQHPFSFPMNFQVSAADAWGNAIVQPIDALNGQLFSVMRAGSGDQLSYFGPGTSRKEVQLRNDLPLGSINANVYKDGRLLATKTGISPGQKAVFEFKPSIWIGVISQVEEGDIINTAIMSDVNTELGLLGVSSADIVMSGGGVGAGARRFEFALANVKYA